MPALCLDHHDPFAGFGGGEFSIHPRDLGIDTDTAELWCSACLSINVIHEVSADDWTLVRQFVTGRGPYNLAVTPDGSTLVATLKQGNAVQFFDLATGESRAISKSTTTITHGVEVTPDSRYAFVTVEGVGAEPGRLPSRSS